MDNYQKYRESNETIAAIATPPGRGGIGIVRVSGRDALKIARQLIGKALQQPRQAMFCNFLDEQDTTIDQGILIYYANPASYTGEDVVEIQGHAGPVLMTQLLNRVIVLGARQARPGEFTERAFLNNKVDLLQAEATIALINSASSQAAKSAIRSLQGDFSKDIYDILQKLIDLRVLAEGLIDFPDEEKEFIEQAKPKEMLSACIEKIDSLRSKARKNALLEHGLQLVIIGSPNVGKSTLFNALVGKQAAIVSDSEGTTRDVLDHNILIEGVPFHILDTAGIRTSQDDVEKQGIKRALKAASQADILLLLLEQKAELSKDITDLLDTYNDKTIVVRNKVDLAENTSQLLDANRFATEIHISAKTGAGMQVLVKRLKNIIDGSETGEDSYMARTRHLNALTETYNHLNQGIQYIQQENVLELFAEELRLAQNALGKITGSFITDDLLAEIFSKFCIGK